ncbi:MAG: STAS/SEC14 domain-containing protein [Chloroflexi bacterium]|nr:STAS/SEC14 domain-containing protein [Chloroflexota bacterium]
MIEVLRNEGNFLAFRLSGKLHDADYKQFMPLIQTAADKGKLHLLVEMQNFEGWDPQALWDDIRLDAQYGDKIERLAVIGDRAWQAWMTKICRPFTSARIEYFDARDTQGAWAWVQDGL